MGEASAVFGRITSYGEKENSHNIEVVSKLQSQNEGYNLFTNEMFNRNKLHGKMDYTIGFARSYNNIESNWEKWIIEFERILSKCKWNSAKVILETEMLGSHQYTWINKFYNDDKEIKVKNHYNLIEKDKWYFGQGHRNFWGMRADLGWKSEFEEVRTLSVLAELLNNQELGNKPILNLSNAKQGQLETSKNEFKHMLSTLIKLYLKEVQKTIPKYPIKEYGELNLFDKNSQYQISKLVLKDMNNSNSKETEKTTWMNKLVDNLITNKKKNSL